MVDSGRWYEVSQRVSVRTTKCARSVSVTQRVDVLDVFEQLEIGPLDSGTLSIHQSR